MSDIRRYIALVEEAQGLDEVYSKDNKYLLDYMRSAEFDPWQNWWAVCRWLEQHDHLDLVNAAIKAEDPNADPVDSADELNDQYDAQIFHELPQDIQKECAEWVIDYMRQHDPAEAPTWAHMDLQNKNLLPRQTWLIHFSDNAREIAYNGFKYGIDQMDQLGLTTWFKDEAKRHGGYNFAYTVDYLIGSRLGNSYESNYGKHAVMFQNSGVHGFHYGDDEDQVIFWGADVRPHNIVWLYNDHGTWQVLSKTKGGDPVYQDENITKVVKWVMANFAQYRKVLTGR